MLRKKNISLRMFDELNCDKRVRDSEKYFKTQIYFRTLNIIIEQLIQRFVGMNHIVNIFNSLIPRNIYIMSENEHKYSASSLVNHYNNDLSIEFVHQISRLLAYKFQNSIKFMI